MEDENAVGIVAREIKATTRVDRLEEPHTVALKLDSGDGDFTAALQIGLRAESSSSTQVGFMVDVTAGGQFLWVANQFIKNQLPKMVDGFAQCASSRLSSA